MMRFAFPFLIFLTAATGAAGGTCTEDIARFQKLLDGDLKTGFVGKEVHAKATGELKQASALCKGGQDAAASAAVVSTRKRYGYPAGSSQNLAQ